MRLRIRTLLLTVALLCGMTSTASACLPPILNPFCWLFGCGYGYGGYGYGYDYGYGYGQAANPYASYRVIDDWLGYGYLRNQEGTLGHYPGRPFGGYQPWFPGLFHPCPPPAPAFAMPGPMVAPMPMPTMHNPCWDPCQSQCADPCMPAPMVQCQPVPVTTWSPVTVDRGHWQRVWVPRPVTTMVPRTQYMAPPAMMSAPMMDSGCGDDCFGGSTGMMPGMSSEPGCCGSEGMMQQQIPYNGAPQSSMMYPGSMPIASNYAMSPNRAMYRRAELHGTMAWSPSGSSVIGGYPVSAYNNSGPFPQMHPRMVRRETQRSVMHFRHLNGPFHQSVWSWQAPNTMGWSQQTQPQVAWAQSMYGQQAYVQPQQFSMSPAPMTAQWVPQSWSTPSAPMAQSMQGTAASGMNVAGDVMGDHELSPATTAAIPMIQNSFSGPVPIMRANLSRPVQTMSASRYPNAVR